MNLTQTSTPLIARAKQMETLRNARARLEKKKGTLVFIPSESGYGKTALLTAFKEESMLQTGMVTVMVECQSPVGNFQVGNLQPLHPFVKVLEELAAQDSKSAEKKLMFNIGMSVLTILPFIGDAIYAVKEIGKDVRDFKKEKASGTTIKSAVSEVLELLKDYLLKSPLVVLLDDMQWSDADSVELLGQFAEQIAELPIMIVVSYRPSLVNERMMPLMSLAKQWLPNEKEILRVDITPFSVSEISAVCEALLPKYKRHREFEQWLWDKSSGIPQIVVEFLHYFERVSPFDSDGNLTSEFKRGELVPASVHAAFGKLVELLTDEERNLLSLCSAEGNECTAFILSKLMNTDIVSVIKKLRTLQQRTGIIHSIGAHNRYGIKTTVYQFGQSFYQEHFHSLLEFEEKTALHNQIATELGKQYEESDEQTRRLIAPYLAAHNAESGNEEAARAMLVVAAQAAGEIGSSAVTIEAHERFNALTLPTESSEQIAQFNSTFESIEKKLLPEENSEEQSSISELSIDVKAIQAEIIELYHDGNFEQAAHLAESTVESLGKSGEDVAQLLVLAAKARIEMGDIPTAREHCHVCLEILESTPSFENSCLVMNTLAVISMSSGDVAQGWDYLHKAAELSTKLTNEYRLLTITNIALLMKKSQPQDAARYKKAAKALSKSLQFSRFSLEAFG
ncbi:MAG: AAA family ATPase [Bacteroidetes bacterium]|nr:AAA family ATPase [Bacteroidota bacterium]